MVTIFVVCWLPLNLLLMAQEYSSTVMRWRYFLLTFLITHVIAMSSNIYNPFLYAWMNDNFKKEFQQVPPNETATFLVLFFIKIRAPHLTAVIISRNSNRSLEIHLLTTLMVNLKYTNYDVLKI